MKTKKIVASLLSLIMIVSLATSVLAVDIATDGGNAKVPVKLTAEALRFSVTVPTSLPVNVDAYGKVTTATDAKIVNNSAGPVKVKDVSVTAVSPWTLTEYADLSGEKVGTQKFGMQIQNTNVSTDGTCSATFDVIPAKSGDTVGSIDLTYDAKVAPQSTKIDTTIANVVFTVGWDEESNLPSVITPEEENSGGGGSEDNEGNPGDGGASETGPGNAGGDNFDPNPGGSGPSDDF